VCDVCGWTPIAIPSSTSSLPHHINMCRAACTFAGAERRCGAVLHVQVDNVLMSARNIEKLEVNFASAVRVYDVLRADKIVIEEEALAYLNVSASCARSLCRKPTLLNVYACRCCMTGTQYRVNSHHRVVAVQEFYA
jgi:Ribosomal protein L4/L1 family